MGNYLRGLANGKPTVTFGMPGFRPSGQVQAVVVAWVGLDWLPRPGPQLAAQVPEGANWTVIDRNGMVLAALSPWPGRRAASVPDDRRW